MFNGVINLYKDQGFTSNDAVIKLRRLLNTKKIGHTGTLDPMATGVLPVCVGKATRLADYVLNSDKIYTAQITFGTLTDTFDSTGTVLQQDDKVITLQQLQDILPQFLGQIQQVPPMYSAIKINGKKLYEYARKGIEIERRPRTVFINDIKILGQSGENCFNLRVHCSKGTYIRALCADMGTALSTFAHMSALERTACGAYTLDTAYSLDKIEQMLKEQDHSFLLPMDSAVSYLKRADILPDYQKQYKNGLQTPVNMVKWEQMPTDGELVRVYIEGEFCGIAQLQNGKLKVKCNLLAGNTGGQA